VGNGRFSLRRLEAARAAHTLTPTATFGFGSSVSGWGAGLRSLVTADFPVPPVSGTWDRATLLSVPAVSRARDLLCSAIGSLPLGLWRLSWGLDRPIEERVPPASWMARPDPARTRHWLLAWTVDDLIFSGRAYWAITERYVTGYPAAFRRLPPTEVTVDAHGKVTHNGTEIPAADVVEFASFKDPITVTGWRSMSTTLQLQAAADRFAATELPAGVLRQTGGEPLDSAELTELADAFTARRRANVVAALNADLSYESISSDPESMQLLEARGYQDLEAARLMDVPPFLIGAPAGTSITYQNAEQARRDLIDFGALPYINCLEQTLGGPNVTPNGSFVRLDLDAWLRSPFTEGTPSPNDIERAYNEIPTAEESASPVPEEPA
jgi:phage portal protein BeeE